MELFTPNTCGIDEVGRGPLAGPVMAACVIIPTQAQGLDFWSQITDSKKLSAKKRDYLFDFIIEHTKYGIGVCSPGEVDSLNIHHATLIAMKRAYKAMSLTPERALIDGKFCPDIPCSSQAVVKGDSKHIEIAAASIIAKVTRDRLMAKLHDQFPYYGWAKNSGYGTAEHRAAIEKHGITEHHRKSFAPCMAYAA